MLVRVLFVLLAGVPVCRGLQGAAYSDGDADVENADLYDSYNNEIKFPQKMTTVMEPIIGLTRRDLEDRRTLNPEEVIDVKAILNNILHGKTPESVRGRRIPRDYSDSYDYVKSSVHVKPGGSTEKGFVAQNQQSTVEVQKWSATVADQEDLDDSSNHATEQHSSFMYPLESTTTYSNSEMQAEVRKLVQHWSASSTGNVYQPDTSTAGNKAIVAEVKTMTAVRDEDVPSRSSVDYWRPSQEVQTSDSTEDTEETADTLVYQPDTSAAGNKAIVAEVKTMTAVRDEDGPVRSSVDYWRPSQEVQTSDSTEDTEETADTLMYPLESTMYSNSDMQAEVRTLVQHWSASSTGNVYQSDTTTAGNKDSFVAEVKTMTPVKDGDVPSRSSVDYWRPSQEVQTLGSTEDTEETEDNLRQGVNDAVMRTGGGGENTTTTTVSNTSTTTTQKIDINALLALIANLTYDYEWNLTEQFNKTLIQHGVPTCPWEKWGPDGAWTASTPVTTLLPWDFENTSVVSKCFVCGLSTPEIPRNAFCADAFAGDFLPLMPTDARSRGKIATFRKYCRYIDVQNYIENPDEPRAIYGRFTGGCSVRWTDLTGVYTQRTCRSRYRPLMGKHFASKRMAKLELALVNVENGCIISPMATLLPVSRGISLYARFHACVCSTNWCNRATIEQASFNALVTILLAYGLVHYP